MGGFKGVFARPVGVRGPRQVFSRSYRCVSSNCEAAMGKKKGGGKKKKLTEEELAAIEARNKKYRDLDLELREHMQERWATLHLKCANNPKNMNFTVEVPVAETSLANVYDRIVGRHGGSISNVSIYRDQRFEANLLQPLAATLVDLGLEGVPEGDPVTYPEYELIYDFKPQNTDCHLLLSNPFNTYDSSIFDEPEDDKKKVKGR